MNNKLSEIRQHNGQETNYDSINKDETISKNGCATLYKIMKKISVQLLLFLKILITHIEENIFKKCHYSNTVV